MKIIVFSDSHGNTENMRTVMRRYRTVDLVIHLGDGSEDIDEVMSDRPTVAVVKLAGNREEYMGFFRDYDLMAESVFTLEGKRFVCCHGHRYHVKNGDMGAICHALEENGDVLLYGHTHEAVLKEYVSEVAGKTVTVMNPGSVGASMRPTYGEITLENGEIKAEIRDV